MRIYDRKKLKKIPFWKKLLLAITTIEGFYRYGSKVLTYLLYNIKFQGTENIPDEGGAILICNHISYVDGLIIHTASPRMVNFVIDEDIYNTTGIKYFMDINGCIPITPNKESVKKAIERIDEKLQDGELVCIFPEGVLTYTGNMSRFKFGIEWILNGAPDDTIVVPMALKGLWGSIFSRKHYRAKCKFIPKTFRRKVNLICGKPITKENAKINHLQQVVMDLKNSID